MIKCIVMSVIWDQSLCLPHMLSSAQGLLYVPSAPTALSPLLLYNSIYLCPWVPITSYDANSLLRTPVLTAKVPHNHPPVFLFVPAPKYNVSVAKD